MRALPHLIIKSLVSDFFQKYTEGDKASLSLITYTHEQLQCSPLFNSHYFLPISKFSTDFNNVSYKLRLKSQSV